MKTMFRKILAMVLCITMLVCIISGLAVTSAAEGEASLTGKYTVDGSVLTLVISLKNNPGINMLVSKLSYDASALSVASVENGDVFCAANGGSMFDVNTAKNPLVFLFEENSVGNITADGTLVTVKFNITSAKDDYGFVLSVDNDNTLASGEGYVPVDVPFAPCTVSERPAVIPGDINGDEKVNVSDGNMMKQLITGKLEADSLIMAAGDLNEDGKINVTDSNMLKRIILGQD